MKSIHPSLCWEKIQDENTPGQLQETKVDVENRQLEEALFKTQAELEQYRILYDNLPSIYFTLDSAGVVLAVNQFGAARLGYAPEDLIAKPIFSILHPEDKAWLQAEVAGVFQKSVTLDKPLEIITWEVRQICKDGKILWVKAIARLVQITDKNTVLLLVCEEIAPSKQIESFAVRVESELRARHQELLTLHQISEIARNAKSLEAAFKLIVEKISVATKFPIVAIELYDSARQVMVFAGVTGIALPPNESILEVPVDQTLSGTVARTNQAVVKTYLPTDSKQCDENETLRKLGIKTFICTPMTAKQRAIGVLSLANTETVECDKYFIKWIESLANYIAELTERQQSQDALLRSEARYRQIIETASEGIWILDAQSKTIFVNSKITEMLGYTAEEMIGMPLFAFMDEEGQAIALDCLERRRQGIKEQHDFKFRRQDGSELWAIVSTNPILDESGQYAGVLGMITDITSRKQAESELRRQTERQRLMGEVAQRIRQSLNLEEILNTTVSQVRNFLQIDRVFIYRFEPDWSGIVVVEDLRPDVMSILRRKILDRCFKERYVQAYKNGRIQATEDIYTAGLSSCHVDFLAALQIKANLVVPIVQIEQKIQNSESKTQNRLWGLLVCNNCFAPRRWQQLEIDLLEQLSTQVAIAIQQAELYQQLQAANQRLEGLVSLDGLTQVANRRRFDEYLEQEWQRLARKQSFLSLILCDIDFFKLYNDTYGHPAGDDCLRQVADALSRAVKRTSDLVARYGGEEFAVILPNTNAEGAVRVAEEILLEVRALKITHVKSLRQQVTVSLGVASTIFSLARSPAKLIDAADRALYQAKETGRDRMVFRRC